MPTDFGWIAEAKEMNRKTDRLRASELKQQLKQQHDDGKAHAKLIIALINTIPDGRKRRSYLNAFRDKLEVSQKKAAARLEAVQIQRGVDAISLIDRTQVSTVISLWMDTQMGVFD